MLKKIKSWFSDFYNWYLTLLSLLVSLPIVAPIMLKIGLEIPAKVIYFIYSFFCHQFASRSIHAFDYQYAWCARDTGIWIGITVIAWLMKYKKVKPIKWYWLIPFSIPMALDGGLQTLFTILNVQPIGFITGDPVYISNNFSRFITGAIFGIGFSLWLSGMMRISTRRVQGSKEARKLSDEERSEISDKTQGKMKMRLSLRFLFAREKLKIVAVTVGLIFVYIFMVQFWNLTSVKNKPLDWVDSAAKTPIRDFFTRREDAVCPTTGLSDLFNFKCFFE